MPQPLTIPNVLAALNLGRSLTGLPAGSRHDRAWRHLTPPNANHHIYWTGPVPKNGGIPRVMVNGQRISIVHFLMKARGHIAGAIDLPLERDLSVCVDTQCYAPEHWRIASPPQQQHGPLPVSNAHPLIARLLAHKPVERHRKVLWSSDGHSRSECPRGHTITLPNYVSSAYYCPRCHLDRKAWDAEFKDLKRRINEGLL